MGEDHTNNVLSEDQLHFIAVLISLRIIYIIELISVVRFRNISRPFKLDKISSKLEFYLYSRAKIPNFTTELLISAKEPSFLEL